MPDLVFAVPGSIDAPTGGTSYARKMLELLPGEGFSVCRLALPSSFPHPSPADLAETARALGGVAPGAILLVDGLAYGALPAEMIAAIPSPVVALVHHPLAHETGLEPGRAAALRASEQRALALARRVIATSRFTARVLSDEFQVPPEKIAVAEPGTVPATRARGTGTPVALLAVGAVSRRKAFDRLVAALAGLAELDWRATIAGALDRDPAAVASLRHAIEEGGLAGRFVLAGAVTQAELAGLFNEADLFVSPSLYEGYGMALAEALARGLPVVASTGGAVADLLPCAGARKVPPGDVAALRSALRETIADPALRLTLAEGAWRAGEALPRWSDTAARVAAALKAAAR